MNETITETATKQEFFESLKAAKNAIFEDVFSRTEPKNIITGGVVLGPLHEDLKKIPGAGFFNSGKDTFTPAVDADLGKMLLGLDGVGVNLHNFYGHILLLRSNDGPVSVPEIRIRAVYDNFGQVYLQFKGHPALEELAARKVWTVSEHHPDNKKKGLVFKTGQVHFDEFMLRAGDFFRFNEEGFIRPVPGLGKSISANGEIIADVPSGKIVKAHILPFVFYSMLPKPGEEKLRELQELLLPLYSENLDEDARKKLAYDLKEGFGGKYPGIEEFFQRCRTELMEILSVITHAQTTFYPLGRAYFFDKNPFYFEAVSEESSSEDKGWRTCVGHINGEPKRRLTLTVSASRKNEDTIPYEASSETIDRMLDEMGRDFV
ncbi:hypothetical protein KY340_01685 [Candidatus Woesearchaeota archaeon]|nr:hypothetical protein [Candidatus Woesearchaeota archaeon]